MTRFPDKKTLLLVCTLAIFCLFPFKAYSAYTNEAQQSDASIIQMLSNLKIAVEKNDVQSKHELEKNFSYFLEAVVHNNDYVRAKKFADLARKQNVQVNYFGTPNNRIYVLIDRCYNTDSPIIPLSDRPTQKEINEFKTSQVDCYSFREDKDDIKYRKCLLSKDIVNNSDVASTYANEYIIENMKLAIALTCHKEDGSIYLEDSVDALYQIAQDEEKKSQEKHEQNELLTMQMTEPQKNAFNSFIKYADDYFYAHSKKEISQNAEMLIDEMQLREELFNSIRSFNEGHIPNGTDFAKADKELNDLYLSTIKYNNGNLGSNLWTKITKNSVKATERNWIKYRDAWDKFAEVKYPKVSKDVWNTWLTKQRIEHLHELEQDHQQ